MIESFQYIADEKTEILVIGSMPGVASLQAGEYYAHPRNLFWRFCFEAFGETYEADNPPSYEAKKRFILQHHIGLWDAAGSCVREGSLDTNIKNVVPNDFYKLFQLYPQIKKLLFNGQTAYKLFARAYPDLLAEKEYLVLPSTSPANASIKLDKKRALWTEAIHSCAKCGKVA